MANYTLTLDLHYYSNEINTDTAFFRDYYYRYDSIPFQQAECAGMFFEEQGAGFRCPQCSGPRRRYAKKVGDRVGTTLDGGDAPILIFSFGGAALTIALGIWAVNNL